MSDSNISQQLLNQQLDEYRLDAILGEGGMACVYRGFDVRLKRPAAIKVIQAPFRGQKDYIARFEREAQAIAQLRHPNIVGIYRYGEVEGLLYIAMEYIEGVDLEIVLADYIERGKYIPPQKISRTIRQLCQALDYAHSKGVIHRDVKPSNVMLDEQGNVILTDFGLVLIDDNTRGEIFGTPYYIAPEQAVSSAKAVPQSDLYAVGVILYEMLTAKLPFMASHPYDVALLHVSEPPPPPRTIRADLSPELEGVVLKAMAKKPEDRYPTGAALADAVDQALFNAFSSRSGRSFSTSMVLRLAGSDKAKPQDQGSSTANPPPPEPVPTPTPHPEPREGKVMIQRYVMRNIHSLLMALTADYSEEDLRQLYIDLPEFKPVQHQLVQSRGKGDLVRRLLDYAEQTMQVDELLGLAKEHNPELYERYEPYYEVITRARELTGQSLGKFSIVERLGRGGMAEVYKAFQPGLARYVALKVIHPHLIDDEEFLERFESEAMAVANLRHPHIIQVFDFDREEDRYYMAMEFVDGPTLESLIRTYKDKGQPFPLAEAVKIFKDLSSAIDYAHSRGMIHRDLKPSNIMFTPRDRLVLTDFGIAHMANMPSYTTANAIVGTPAYMSPEQAKGEPVTERSDIYSLGVMLYELSTGHLPFEGETPLAIIVKLIDGTFPHPSELNPGLSPAIEGVILRALDKNPDARYSTAGEFAQALELALMPPGPQALALSQLERSQPQEKDPDATLMLKAEEYTPPQNKGMQKAEVPVIKIDSPKPATPEPQPQSEPGGSVVNISGNTGQLIFGGGHVIQMGNVSGGTININAGPRPAPAARPAALPDLIAGLRKRLAVEAPPAKQEAAQQHLSELEEALAATPPDQETLALLKHWFKKHVPSLAEEVERIIAMG